MVSSDTARMSIIRRAYDPQTFVTTRYQDVRSVLRSYLSDISRRRNPLTDAARMFEQRAADSSLSSVKQDDARQSIEVIAALQAMQNQLAGYRFVEAPQSQPKVNISGVEVSVRADLWVYGERAGEQQIGAALLRMTQDDRSQREDMGRYVAVLMRMHLDQNNPTNRVPVNRLCMAIDVRPGQVFVAPNASARRFSDLQAACQQIHALWGRA